MPDTDRDGSGVPWVTVTSFAQRPQAELAAAVLAGNAIPTNVLGDDAGGTYGVSFSGGVEVRVPADRLEEARQVLAAPPYDEDREGPLGDA